MYTMQIHYFCHTHGGLVRTGNYVSKCEDPPFRSQLEKWSLGFQGLCPALAISGIWFFTSVLTLTLYQPLHQFRLKDGIRRVPHYGLLLARVAGLPASVIDTATSITSQITQQVTRYLLMAITRLCHHLLGLYMLCRLLNTAPCVYISRTPISISHLRKHVSFTSGLVMSTQLSMENFVYLPFAGNDKDGCQLRGVQVSSDGIPGCTAACMPEVLQPRWRLHPWRAAEAQGGAMLQAG